MHNFLPPHTQLHSTQTQTHNKYSVYLMLMTDQRPAQFNAPVVHVDDLEHLRNLTAVHVLHQLHLLLMRINRSLLGASSIPFGPL